MFNLSVYHRGDQQSCVRFNLWSFRQFSVIHCEQQTHVNALARTLEDMQRHIEQMVHIPLFGSVGIG
jgi:hypothetical protein